MSVHKIYKAYTTDCLTVLFYQSGTFNFSFSLNGFKISNNYKQPNNMIHSIVLFLFCNREYKKHPQKYVLWVDLIFKCWQVLTIFLNQFKSKRVQS